MSTPAKRTKRSYSDEEVGCTLALLKSNGGNLLRTERETGIPRQTIGEWARNKRRNSTEVLNIRHQKEVDVLGAYATVERACLAHASQAVVITEMSGLDAVKAAGIARDKQQVMLGQPTSIHEERTIDSRQVLVLLQDSLGRTDPPERNITPAPATAAIDVEARHIAPSAETAETQTEGRFSRILRERRESSPSQD